MEILHLTQVEFSLVLSDPGAKWVVDIARLLPLLLLNLRAHVPPGNEGDDGGEKGSSADCRDVTEEHGQFLASVFDKGGSREAAREGAGIAQPGRHSSHGSTHNSADEGVAGGPGPQDGDRDGEDAGGDEDAGEVVGPGQVEVDSPAEQTEGDGEEGEGDDAPVLVVEEMLLVLLVLLVDRAGVVRLHHAAALSSHHQILLKI